MPNNLSNKQYKSYQKVSRYSHIPYYYNNIDMKYLYGTWTSLKKNIPFTTHIVKENDTLDTLALYYYNNPTYFWIIADFNDIHDPFNDLEINYKLKIPTFSTLEFN